MKSIFSWFTLIEVIVATSILSLSIFGIYKLIGENIKLIWNSSALSTSAILLNNAKECIKYFWYDAFWNSGIYSVNFGSDNFGCATGIYDSDYTFSGVTMDSRQYFLSAEIVSSATGSRDWDLTIFEESLGKKQINWTQMR